MTLALPVAINSINFKKLHLRRLSVGIAAATFIFVRHNYKFDKIMIAFMGDLC